ncbi:MAG: alkaline phosphatase family protein [Acidimicrobiales bacterium]
MAAFDRTIAKWHLRHRDRGWEDERARPSEQPGHDSLPEIEHIVLLMMENHSFDNYLGTLGHGDGLPVAEDGAWGPVNELLNGEPVRPFHLASTVQQNGVPTQSWNASHIQFDDGANDGFVRSIKDTVPGGDGKVPMGFWTAEDLPFYAGLAKTFALADRWHCSLLGPTFPNRRFLIAGTANGLIDDAAASMMDYPRTGTVFDLLDRNDINWVNYHHAGSWRVIAKRLLGNGGLRGARTLKLLVTNRFPKALKVGLDNLQFTAALYPVGLWRCLRHLRHARRFFIDARRGKLPPVSIVDPDFQSNSEENPYDIRLGEKFAAEVIDAVMKGPGWEHTLLIWFYDEHGGYYDHVPPPSAVEPDDVRPRSLLHAGAPLRWVLQHLGLWKGLRTKDFGAGRYDRLGFRVPAVIVSPFAKAGYVSSTVYDHTSVLKLIEEKWNLPPLTKRDAAAVAPLDMLDLKNPPFRVPPTLPAPAMPFRAAG